ncbi:MULTISPECIES: ABC transporter permease subunit [Cellulomonas]|uniref:ABC transporter permease subunit n=1 Tax=Cellulomonas TaxID=1707 RepID=UPI0010A92E45|nr:MULTISPECIES: ABC transporter permease subunit [Cellulomonas]
MSTLAPTPGPARTRVTVHPVTFRRLLASEWVKLRSLRSTWWALAVAVVAGAALGPLQTMSVAGVIPDDVVRPDGMGAAYALAGAPLALLTFCTFGVLGVAGEYGTGQIRSTLVAAPTRLPALLAKLVVTVAAVLVASTVMVAVAVAATLPVLGRAGMTLDLTRPEDARIVLGMPLFLAAASALGFTFGALTRSTAAGITVVLGLVLVVENGLGAIPWAPLQELVVYLPANAGARLVTSDALGSVLSNVPSTLPPWTGFGVMLAWVAGLLAVACVLLRRRDA